MSNLVDKNKSAYKLQGIGPIYLINLDDQPERWNYMQEQFKYWEIEDKVTRISAYDGREDDLGHLLKGTYPRNMSSGEVGCSLSHLKALRHYLDNSDSPYAIIMEDDCCFDTVRYWNFTWKEFYSKVPYDWDVVQIAIICTGDIHVKIHKRFVNEFSTACYLISRHHAEKMMKLHYKGKEKYKLDQDVRPRAVADDLIFNSGNTYSIPMLLYRTELGSSIHPEHVDAFHVGNYNAQMGYWEQTGAQRDIDDMMDFDPYLGRISNPSQPEAQPEQ